MGLLTCNVLLHIHENISFCPENPNKTMYSTPKEEKGHPAKVLISKFYLCPHSKPPLQNCLIDSQDFLTWTVQGSIYFKSKIKL